MFFNREENAKIQKGKGDAQFNTETMLPISEIKDGYLILKDHGIRAILKVDGINLDLKNFQEIQIVLEQYKRFLNSLEFPIQFLIRNTFLDLREYLYYVNQNIEKIDHPAIKKQWRNYYRFLEDINMKQGLVYVKEFYLVIPFYESNKDAEAVKKTWREKFMNALNSKDDIESIVARYRSFVKGQKQLDTRINLVKEGLNGMGIRSEQLNTGEIIALLFAMYNPLIDSTQAQRE